MRLRFSKKFIHCFTVAPFPILVCGKNAFYSRMRHVTEREVVITRFGHYVKLALFPEAQLIFYSFVLFSQRGQRSEAVTVKHTQSCWGCERSVEYIILQSPLKNLTFYTFNNRNPSLRISTLWKHLLEILYYYQRSKRGRVEEGNNSGGRGWILRLPLPHPPLAQSRLINSIHNRPFLPPSSRPYWLGR